MIAKVHAQTENGFKQYLTRALREGASADEILDALPTAFPVLGLAKIVWATDILLAMDIPEFRPALLGAPAQWHDVAAVTDLKEGQVSYFTAVGRHVFHGLVYRALAGHGAVILAFVGALHWGMSLREVHPFSAFLGCWYVGIR